MHLRWLPVSHLRCISRANLRFKKFAIVLSARSLNCPPQHMKFIHFCSHRQQMEWLSMLILGFLVVPLTLSEGPRMMNSRTSQIIVLWTWSSTSNTSKQDAQTATLQDAQTATQVTSQRSPVTINLSQSICKSAIHKNHRPTFTYATSHTYNVGDTTHATAHNHTNNHECLCCRQSTDLHRRKPGETLVIRQPVGRQSTDLHRRKPGETLVIRQPVGLF
jgi:hypothetical protein